jgi:peptidoglycan/xylan/chitin deacetylase (PgdA/CDA1 family)
MATGRIQKIITPLIRPFYQGIGHILMFHRICDDAGRIRVPGAANIEYPPAKFACLLDQLQNAGYQFISLDELSGILLTRNKVPEFIVITFDDGYADNFTTAYPILKERNIPFSIYVTASFPDEKAVIWWYILEDMINQNRVIEFGYKGKEYRFDTSNPEGKQQFGSSVRMLMKSSSIEDLLALVQKVMIDQGIDPLQKVRELSLSWDQLKILSKEPLATIGAHTMNHLLLKELPVELAKEEIYSGRSILEEKLGVKVHHFAYPFGGKAAAGSREFQIVREAGFKTATTTRQANIFPDHKAHMECLPRLDMGSYPDYSSLKPALDGWVPARINRFKRVVTG